MRKIFLLVTMLTAFFACKNSRPAEIPEHFDYGKIEEHIYTNSFFNFQIQIPDTWAVQSKEIQEAIRQTGRNIISEKSDLSKEELDVASIGSAQLLTVFKHDLAEKKVDNPALVILAENIANMPHLGEIDKYFNNIIGQLKYSSLKFQADKDYKDVNLGNYKFRLMKTQAQLSNGVDTLYQDYYGLTNNNFVFAIIATYVSKESGQELNQILRTIKNTNLP